MQDVIFNTYPISSQIRELHVDEFGYESFERRLIFLPPRICRTYMLHYVIKGEGTLTLDGKVFPLKKGALFLCPPNVKLTYHSSTHSPYSYFWINFVGNLAKQKVSDLGLSVDNPVIYPQNAEQITKIFNKLLKFTSPETQDIALSCLYALFYYVKDDKGPKRKDVKSVYVEKAINYIDANYTNPALKISHVAEHLHLSQEYLSKIFKEETKITIISFLITKRMEEAYKLIKSGVSVSESAEKCGYLDLCNFSKTYSKHFGFPPSKTL